MAIQLRRGDYEDFDKSKMQEGELAVVTQNDPNTISGQGVYVCYENGNSEKVKRLVNSEDYQEDFKNLSGQLRDEMINGEDLETVVKNVLPDYAENELTKNDLFAERLARNTMFDKTIASTTAFYDTLASNPYFTDQIAEIIPRNDRFMSIVGSRIGVFWDGYCSPKAAENLATKLENVLPKDDKFMSIVGSRIGSFWDGNCASQTAYALANKLASYLPNAYMFTETMASKLSSNTTFMSSIATNLTENSDFMATIGNDLTVNEEIAGNLPADIGFVTEMASILPSMMSRNLSSMLPSLMSKELVDLMTSDIVGGIAKDSSFLKNVADSTGFGGELATNTYLQRGLAGQSIFGEQLVQNGNFLRSAGAVLPSYLAMNYPFNKKLVPDYTSSDSGKFLKITSSGVMRWASYGE